MTAPVCGDCTLEPAFCLCSLLPKVTTRTDFVILRHRIETRKRTNSARIAALALANCRIVEHGGEGEPFDAAGIDWNGAWLLYPGGQPAVGVPKSLFILDGSWRQARRMFLRIPELQRLPRLSLPAPAVTPNRLRRTEVPDGMATLEAMAHAVEMLEGEGTARPLHELYRLFVERSTRSAQAAGRRPSVG